MIVRKLRLQRGWTQDQLAEMAGLSVRTVQRLERGDRPSLETAKALGAVFEVDHTSFHPEEPVMVQSAPAVPPAQDPPKVEVSPEESAALSHARSVKSFYEGLLVWLAVTVTMFIAFGVHEPIVWACVGGAALAVVFQGLLSFETIRLPGVDYERRLAEKKLGRRL